MIRSEVWQCPLAVLWRTYWKGSQGVWEGQLGGSGGCPGEKCGQSALGGAGAGAGNGEMRVTCGLCERQGSVMDWKRRGPNSWILQLVVPFSQKKPRSSGGRSRVWFGMC